MVNIYVLDNNFQSVGVIDVYESLLWTDRFYKYGEFELYTAFDAYILGICQQDYYMYINESEHMMIIESIEIESDADNGNKLKITGRSLECILDKRIIWPSAKDGYTEISNKTTLQDALYYLVDDAMIHPQPYNGSRDNNPRRRNAKQQAIADDRTINLAFDKTYDPAVIGFTMPLTYYSGENLYEVTEKLLEDDFEGVVGYKIILDENNKFRMSLYTGVDRSYNQEHYIKTMDTVKSQYKQYYEKSGNNYVLTSDTKLKKNKTYYEYRDIYPFVVFSPQFDNVVNSNYLDSIESMRNVAFVAGEEEEQPVEEGGEGGTATTNKNETLPPAKRKYTLIVGKGTGMARREWFSDASDLREEDFDDNDDLMQALKDRGKDDLNENSRVKSYEGEVEAERQFVYGKDFFMGDVIQMANEYGIEGSARVVEWVLSISKDGIKAYPTFDAVKLIDDTAEEEDNS